ncbi:hypothetical protein AAFN75_06695 [Algibacter sp. AS12]|uniref:hypothetical protein n=1 Tax=Algibacter sp. AS12 TaxID=3135773 RepID=UPI00398A6A31
MHQLLKQKLNYKALFFLLLLVVSAPLCSQGKESIPEIEKVYLHTDRTTYVAGESLWYKAYLVYAYNHLLFDHSGILYVELVSPDSRVVARNNTKLIGGLGHGDFELTKSNGINKIGKYQIRAYTNWSRNFGNDFIFKKEIEIIDVFESQKIANNAAAISNAGSNNTVENKRLITETNLDIQFFPEGGPLIENVSSVVAFKAADKNGNPVNIQGQILDDSNEVVAMFASVHDGMGKFALKPTKGQKYHAKITVANTTEIEMPLPKVQEEGFVLSSRKIKDTEILTIKTNEQTLLKHPNSNLTIRYASRGITYFEEVVTLAKGSLSIQLPKDNLPEGITQITLFDDEARPQSERLVYINKNQNVNVVLSTDKTTYSPREKVVLKVLSKNSLGEAVPASYSIASTDLNGVKDEKNYSTNISSYFLMESDIRGKIHNAGYYFDASNPNRFRFLDLLLLTQGWRDFLWKQLPEVKENPIYDVEKGINISGRVKQLFGSKPAAGNTISLALFNKSIESFTEITDDSGKFSFNDLEITGKARIMLNTKNKRGKNDGMFVLDSIFNTPIAVDYKANNESANLSSDMSLVANNIYKKHIDFEVLPENILDEVEINGKKRPTAMNTIHKNLLGNSYVVGTENVPFSNIFQLLTEAVPLLEIVNNELIKFTRNNSGALIVINNIRILDPSLDENEPSNIYNYLSSYQPDDIIRIESDNTAVASMMYGDAGKNGVILIYTKENKDFAESKTKKDYQSIKKQIVGYYEARTFYSPDLENTTEKSRNAAIRNTLYWNPYIHPDTKGNAQVEYFNTAVETEVKVTLQGITATGIPVVVKTKYNIAK